MVRMAALVLLLANAVYFAWSQGLLAAYGFAPEAVSEPERLQQQVHPEMVLVLPPGAADAPVAVASAAPAPTECLTAGVLDAARGSALTKALAAALPADAWTLAGLHHGPLRQHRRAGAQKSRAARHARQV
jgi:hypothetical protein